MGENQVKTEQFKDSLARKIPTGWQVERLSNFYAFPARNGLYKSAQYYGRGVLMIHMPQMFRGLEIDILDAARVEVNPTELERFELKPGDLVFARRSLNLEGAGRCSLVPEIPEPVTFESSIIRVRLLREHLRPAFANYFLNSEIGFRLRLPLIRQVAVSGVSSEDIASIPILVPPIPEQESIIEIIDTIDEAIAHTTTLIDKLKQMKAGLLHDLLTRGLDENGELRDPTKHPEQFKDSPLGQIPKSWQCDVAKAFCNDIVVGVVCNATDSYVKHGVPFLRSQNIRLNSIDTNGMLYISPSFNILQSKSILHAGDVVIVRTGYPGTAAVVPNELEGANCFSLIVVRPNRTLLNSYFFTQYLNSEGCKASIDRAHFGSAQHNFNIGEMDKLLIAVPPLTEQTEIVCRIEALDTRIRTEEAYCDKLKLQKQGLMHDLLTGKLRVKI